MRVTAFSLAAVVATFAACAVPNAAATAAGITTLYNTGVDNAGNVLANGATDTHYTLTQQPGTSYSAQVVGSSLGNQSGLSGRSQFVGPNSNTNADGPGGTYIYRTTFSLAGYSAATAAISGVWSADDVGADILLNGTSIGLTAQPTWYSSTAFKILSGFVAGMNTLDFVLRNDQGATGLRVEMTGTANAVPEPASVLLLAMGIGGIVLLRKRLQRASPSV